MKERDLESVQFGRGDDMRVIVTGTNLPFRFGTVRDMSVYKDFMTIRIERDNWTESAVLLDPDHEERVRSDLGIRPSWFGRLLDRLCP